MKTLWEELLPMTSRLYGYVLDVACGNGEYSRRLNQLPAVDAVVSMDIVPFPETYGQRFTDNRPVATFFQGSIEDMSVFPADEFDCVMCWHTIEHTQDPVKAVLEVRRVCRNLVMWALPRPQHGAWDSSDHVYCWDVQPFCNLLEQCGYSVEDVYIDQCGCQNLLTRIVSRADIDVPAIRQKNERYRLPGR